MEEEVRIETDTRVRRLLAGTLDVWGIEGVVEAARAPAVARVRAGGMAIRVERAPLGDPFRWFLHLEASDPAAGGRAPRPCGSLVGVLSGLRRMLGLESGMPVRVVREAR